MIYADKWFLTSNLDIIRLQDYELWLAHYTGVNNRYDALLKPSNYSGEYSMWQYTSSGNVNGITGNVDMNIGYKSY